MDGNLITIIVPVFNAEATLAKAVDSVLAQSYAPIEMILVDDGSSDGSAGICDAYAAKHERVKAIHTENRGVSAARNTALAEARGAYVGFLDSDDWLDARFCATLVALFENGDVQMVSCGLQCEFAHGAKSGEERTDARESVTKVSTAPQTYGMVLKDENVGGYACNKLFLRNLIERGFDEDLAQCEDFLFVARYLKSVKNAAHINLPLYHYLQGGAKKDYGYSKRALTLMPAYERVLSVYEEQAVGYAIAVRVNVLKVYLNFRARYRLTKDTDPERKALIRAGIRRHMGPVLKSSAVPNGAKANILLTYWLPGVMLRIKRRLLARGTNGHAG